MPCLYLELTGLEALGKRQTEKQWGICTRDQVGWQHSRQDNKDVLDFM